MLFSTKRFLLIHPNALYEVIRHCTYENVFAISTCSTTLLIIIRREWLLVVPTHPNDESHGHVFVFVVAFEFAIVYYPYISHKLRCHLQHLHSSRQPIADLERTAVGELHGRIHVLRASVTGFSTVTEDELSRSVARPSARERHQRATAAATSRTLATTTSAYMSRSPARTRAVRRWRR